MAASSAVHFYAVYEVRNCWMMGVGKDAQDEIFRVFSLVYKWGLGVPLFVGGGPKSLLMDQQGYSALKNRFESVLHLHLNKCAAANCQEAVRLNSLQELLDATKEIRADKRMWRKEKTKAATAERAKEPHIEAVRQILRGGDQMVSVDVEAYEHHHDTLLEIGYTVFNLDGSVEITHHIIIEETQRFSNGRYVPDKKYDFNFGVSRVLPMKAAFAELTNVLKDVKYLLGLNFKSDVKFLRGAGFHLPASTQIYDLDHMAKQRFGTKHSIKLSRMLKALDVPFSNLHNAGNDAYYTVQVLRGIMGNEDLGGLIPPPPVSQEKLAAQAQARMRTSEAAASGNGRENCGEKVTT